MGGFGLGSHLLQFFSNIPLLSNFLWNKGIGNRLSGQNWLDTGVAK